MTETIVVEVGEDNDGYRAHVAERPDLVGLGPTRRKAVSSCADRLGEAGLTGPVRVVSLVESVADGDPA